MEKKNNFAKVMLTVILASAAIVGSTYAYRAITLPGDPLNTVEIFYGEWLSHEGNPITDEIYKDHQLLTEGLEEKIENIISDFDKGAYDPVLLAQDKPQHIEFNLSRQGEKTAIVDVAEDFGGNKQTVKVDLLKDGGRWQISDIRSINTGEQPLASTGELQREVVDHIKSKITELSPEEAVLGGTFYVTEVSFKDGDLAIVEYEDGHIALVAEARYELLPDGSVRINNFEMIED